MIYLNKKSTVKETFFRAKTNVGKKYRDINITKEKFENNASQINPINTPVTILELYNKLDDIKTKINYLKTFLVKYTIPRLTTILK